MGTHQTTTYKKRLRKRSGLSPMARLVAVTIADLRYEAGLRPDEPLSLTMAALAAECGMKSKNTARRWLEEAIAAGWIIAAVLYRDHRQQANQYYTVDPGNVAEVSRLTSAIEGSGARLLRSSVRPKPVKRLDTVLRSKNNGAADDAAHRGGGGSDEEGQPSGAEVTRLPSATSVPAGDGDEPPAVAALTKPLHHRCPHPACRAHPGRPCAGLPGGRFHSGRKALADQAAAVTA